MLSFAYICKRTNKINLHFMNKIVLLLVGLLISCLSFAQTTIWSSDFSNGSDWNITNNSATGSLNWIITNTKPTTFNKAESNWINAFTAFNSKSLGNYAVVDGTNAGAGTRTAIITSKNSFSTSGKSKVKVTFNQFYTKWQDVVSLEVSTNNTTWTPFVCNSTVAKGGSTANPNVYSVDISSVASDKQQVWIRFVYAGKVGDYDYAWFIDDVSVEEIVSKELSPFSAFFYSKSSSCGLINDKVGFAVINNGIDVVANGTPVAYKVNNGTEVLETATWLDTKLQSKTTFAQGDTALFFFNKPVDLSATQTYNVTVYTKLVGDGNVANDSAKVTIINYAPTLVNNTKIFNEDFENPNDYLGGFTAETIDQNGVKFGIAAVGNTSVNSSSGSNCFRIYENNVSRVSEDWLYTRCLNLSPDYTYTLSFYNRVGALTSGSNAGKIQTSIGTSPTSASMTAIVGAEKSLKPDGKYYENKNTFNVSTEGVYYIGFRARNTAADSTINLRIDDVSITAKGKKADFLTFSLKNPAVNGVINSKTITLDVASGTNVTALISTFTTSPGAVVKVLTNIQSSGANANNFTNSITYVVTSEDGLTSNNYIVTVNVPQTSKSSEKDILTYSINGVNGVISGNNITVTLPSGTSLSNLTAVYTTSPKSSVTTGANTTNFTSPVSYVVTAEDLTTKTYTVTVTVSSSNQNTAADILTFGFTNPNVNGVISGTAIMVTVPYGTNIKSLVSSFTVSTGASVKVSSIVQNSGGSVIDYTAPVSFAVTSQDGKTVKTYIVTVTITPLLSSAKEMISFGFASPSTVGTISGSTIGLTVPFGTNVSALIANFTSSPNSIVRVGSTVQVSGTTPNNFNSTLMYTVIAQDGSTKDYTVVVTISSQSGGNGSSAKEILSFGLLSPYISGSISSNSITIIGQAGSDITKQQIYFSVSPGATLTLNGVILTTSVSIVNFSNPVNVTVTALDGSKKDYVVTVVIPKKSDKVFTFFRFIEVPSAIGVINDSSKTITVHVPQSFANNLNFTAVFGVSTGAIVKIGNIQQSSGASQLPYKSTVVYTVVAEDGTTENYTIIIIVDPQVAGIEEEDNTLVRIFPNPSIGIFTCESSIESYALIVTDLLGHTVYSTRVEPNGTSTHTFDISTFGSGVYFATIQSGDSSKLIKLEVVK